MNDYDFQQELGYIEGHDPWEHSIGGGYDLENRRWNRLVNSRGGSRFGPAPTSGFYLPFQLMLMFAGIILIILVVMA